MQQDYFGFKRDKGGASHGAVAGYTPSDYWSMYASSFAQDGSDDQLIAAMTKSVPEAWLKANGFTDADTLPDLEKNQLFKPGSGYRGVSADGLNRDSSHYMDMYSRGLQTRLRNDFKNSKKGIENQGVANLRDQSQDALSQDLKGIDADANSRGLLFSGKREAARGAAAAARSNELGQVAGDYSRQLSDTERQLNSDVFLSEMDTAFKQADMNDILSGNFYNKMKNNSDMFAMEAQAANSLGKRLGNASGALKARLDKGNGG